MKISVHKNNNKALLAFEGEMTIYHAADIKQQLLAALNENAELELDLAQISDMDSAGVQVLMLAKREASLNDKILQLSAHSKAVLDVFELFNLAAYFGDPLLISSAAANAGGPGGRRI